MLIILILILYIWGIYKKDIWEHKFEERVSDIYLHKTIYNDKCLQIDIAGYVAFPDLREQPRKIRQYKIIKTNGHCIYKDNVDYESKNIVKMKSVVIRPDIISSELFIVENNTKQVILSDKDNHETYIIDKSNNGKVIVKDSRSGHVFELITSNLKFQEFIEKWQNER